jgi:uncharacterized protein with PIN domain
MGTKHRFLADAMLGRLARWLRILGWDAEYIKDAAIAQLIEAATGEGRILLTRRQGVKHKSLIYVESEILEEQLRQLETTHKILTDAEPFSRCILCNTELYEIDKEEARGKVPFYISQTHDLFYRCPSCGKVYWKGTHHEQMLRKLLKLSSS